MRVVDQENGEERMLHSTPELRDDIRRYFDAECKHTSSEVRRVPVKGGASQLRNQCLHCGILVGNALPKSAISTPVNDKDETLEPHYMAARCAERDRIDQ